MKNLLNLALFQLSWFACVLGAANGAPWLGPLFVAAGFLLHLRLSGAWASEARIGATALAMGLAADSAAMSAGAFEFPPQARFGWPVPIWMGALWLNLATTLNASLRWLKGRAALAAIFGGVGGPLSYVAGERLGAIALSHHSLAVIALEWTLAMPLLLWVAGRLQSGSVAR